MCICGREDCMGLCDASIGKRLVEFYINWRDRGCIRDIDVGKIELDSSTISGSNKGYLITAGAEYFPEKDYKGKEITSKILKPAKSMSGMVLDPVCNYNKIKINNCLIAYADTFGANKDLAAEARQFFRDWADYKKVLIPIPMDSRLDVIIHKNELGKPKSYRKEAILKRVKWSLDNDGKLSCKILTHPEREQLTKWKDIEDFGTELFDKQLMNSKIGKENMLVKMSHFGYFKPVIISGLRQHICIDNSTLYLGNTLSSFREIGRWEGTNIKSMEFNRINEPGLLDTLKNYRPYLSITRKRMAPYLVSDATIVQLKDLMS